MTPEQKARQTIDHKLAAAGWVVQDMKAFNLGAAQGIAVREYPTDTGPADYVLFVDRQAVGVIGFSSSTTMTGEATPARTSVKSAIRLCPNCPKRRGQILERIEHIGRGDLLRQIRGWQRKPNQNWSPRLAGPSEVFRRARSRVVGLWQKNQSHHHPRECTVIDTFQVTTPWEAV